jgi:hypothetical protein
MERTEVPLFLTSQTLEFHKEEPKLGWLLPRVSRVVQHHLSCLTVDMFSDYHEQLSYYISWPV